jgi:acetyl esterase
MPVDPQVQAVVDQMAGAPGLTEMPLDAARSMIAGMNAAAGEPEPVHSVEDRVIPGPESNPIPLRVYRTSDDDALPVVVFVHGGGFTMGDLDSHDSLCRALANASECVLVAVDYRLAPEHRFPAGIDDTYAATCWVHEHAAELGGDPARLAIGGDSGGGTFATTICGMARERGGPPIGFQFLINPGGMDFDYTRPSCIENSSGYFISLDDVRWIESQYFASPDDKERDWRAAPGLAPDLSGLPPAIVLTAEYDPVRDQGRAYVERLRDAGVPVQHTEYPGVLHGWVNMFGVIDAGRKGLDETANAIRTALARPAVNPAGRR